MNKKLKGFFQLIRLPNQFTLPGDILCGFLLPAWYASYILKSHLSSGATLLTLILISVLIYSFGLIQNDVFGYEEDKHFGRSSRPLVSGIIKLKSAKLLCFIFFTTALLLGLAINATTVAVTAIIAVLCTIYNRNAHKYPMLTAPVMGLCRGFNIILGASAYGTDLFNFEILNFPLWCCIIFHTLYIAGVTLIAANENEGGPSRFLKHLPFVAALLLITVIQHWLFMILCAWILFMTSPLNQQSSPSAVGAKIGQLIGMLILSQLCWIVLATKDVSFILPIAMCYFCNRALSHFFYSS